MWQWRYIKKLEKIIAEIKTKKLNFESFLFMATENFPNFKTQIEMALLELFQVQDSVPSFFALSIYDFRPLEGTKKIFDAIFGIFRVELGGLDMKTGKISKFIKINLYMTIPTHRLICFTLNTFLRINSCGRIGITKVF